MQPAKPFRLPCRFGLDSLFILTFLVILIDKYLPFAPFSTVLLYDETAIMLAGLTHNFSYAQFESSPLYADFYQLCSIIWQAPLALYTYVHLILFFGVLLAVAIVVYWRVRRLSVCLLIVFMLAFSPLYEIWPHINFLTSISLIALFSAIFLLKDVFFKLIMGMYGAYFLIFLRPEFYVTFYLLMGVTVFVVCRWMLVKKENVSVLGLLAVLPLLWMLVFFVCPVPSDSSRSFIAFSQHYSLAVHVHEGLTSDLWLASQAIMRRDFGDVNSILQAVIISPVNVAQHLWRNVLLVGPGLLGMACLFTGYFTYVYKKHAQLPLISDIALLMSFALPTLISFVVIYPRQHYILIIMALVLMLFLSVKPRKQQQDEAIRWQSYGVPVLILLCAFVFPPLMYTDRSDDLREEVMLLQDFEMMTPLHNVLEVDGGWCAYLTSCDKQYRNVSNLALAQIIYQVDTIFVSKKMQGVMKGQALETLVNTPERYGFSKYIINSSLYLLIKGDFQ